MERTRDEIMTILFAAEERSKTLAPRALAVELLDEDRGLMAAANSEGNWAIAIKSRSSTGYIPAVHLATLRAEYGVKCQLDEGGVSDSVRVSLVQCRTHDPEIKNLFATFVAALVSDLPQAPSDQTVADAVGRWVTLFWRLRGAPRTSVVGLIGELVVLGSGRDTPKWVAAWHNSPIDAIDFGFVDPRLEIEVKATTGRERVHTLAIHQSKALDAERYFASLLVELRDTGITVEDAAQAIADRLPSADDRLKFWATVADACGEHFSDYLSTRFIQETSASTLAFYPVDEVPAPEVCLPLPIGVSDLAFRSDFSSVLPVDSAPILGR